jgi:hypothetical protein
LAELLESNASPKPKLGRKKVPNLDRSFVARAAPSAHDDRISDHLYARKEEEEGELLEETGEGSSGRSRGFLT